MVDRIPLFPLDAVVYPGEPLPLHVFEERYCLMIEECLTTGAPFGISLVAPGQGEETIEYAPENVGTAVMVLARELLPDGRMNVATIGHRRYRIRRLLHRRPYQEADVTWLDEPVGDEEEAARGVARVRDELARVHAEGVADEATNPVEASYAVAVALDAPLEIKQWILEAESAEERLELETALLRTLDVEDASPVP